MKYINISDDNRKKLEEIFDVTRQAVYLALYYKSDSETSQKIRNVAVREMGGRIIQELDITSGWQPNCETVFEHSQSGVSKIISTFSNNVQVVLDCHENTAGITRGDEELRRYWKVRGSAWGNILYAAEQLSVAN